MAAVNALNDMCAQPEYINTLRDEASVALLANDNLWQYSIIKQLQQMDSFLKESLRLNQPDTRKYFDWRPCSSFRRRTGLTELIPSKLASTGR